MKRGPYLTLGLAALLLAGTWLTLGIEEIPREHGTDYEFFAKQTPTLQIVFRNPAVCGECDTPPLQALSSDVRQAFGAFCRARFGLDDVAECHAIYAQRQRAANARLAPASAGF